MSDRDLFVAMVLAAMSAGNPNPIAAAESALRELKIQDRKGNIPNE